MENLPINNLHRKVPEGGNSGYRTEMIPEFPFLHKIQELCKSTNNHVNPYQPNIANYYFSFLCYHYLLRVRKCFARSIARLMDQL